MLDDWLCFDGVRALTIGTEIELEKLKRSKSETMFTCFLIWSVFEYVIIA